MAGLAMASPRVKSSWDTQQRLPYNPNAPRSPQKAKPITKTTTIETPLTLSASSSTSRKLNPSSVSELLKRKNLNPTPDLDETYMGYEIWMPVAPKVEKPRSIYNAASLAYIGDCIYELYARRHFLFPPLDIEEYNDRVMAVVRCEAQDMFLQKLLDDNFLVDEERNVLRWGKNVSSGKSTKTKKRAGVAIYNRASALETLVGYLYLTNMKRLDEVMQKLGFANGASTQSILEEENKKLWKALKSETLWWHTRLFSWLMKDSSEEIEIFQMPEDGVHYSFVEVACKSAAPPRTALKFQISNNTSRI